MNATVTSSREAQKNDKTGRRRDTPTTPATNQKKIDNNGHRGPEGPRSDAPLARRFVVADTVDLWPCGVGAGGWEAGLSACNVICESFTVVKENFTVTCRHVEIFDLFDVSQPGAELAFSLCAFCAFYGFYASPSSPVPPPHPLPCFSDSGLHPGYAQFSWSYFLRRTETRCRLCIMWSEAFRRLGRAQAGWPGLHRYYVLVRSAP